MSPSALRRLLVAACLGAVCCAQSADLTAMSLEDLAKVQVTSASRKPERLASAPAAIYVLTGEMIREGGFTTLPDALRMVPGLYVAQTDSHTWQISTRGFSDVYNNKMLVLVDGRSVYTPLYGGVYWDALDIPLENIERVEVIRGPGGTLWGANAVNGVINIVTKSADQARGAMVSTSFDKDTGYTTTVRYGGALGSNAAYYAYGRAAYWEPFASRTGGYLPNRLTLPQAGLRVDWTASPKDSFSLEGGAFDGRARSTSYPGDIPATFVMKGNNAQVEWTHHFSGRSTSKTLAYCDWYTREVNPGESRTTCDAQIQDDFEINARNSLIWGGSFDTTADNLTQHGSFMSPPARRNNVVSGFAQYGLVLLPDRLRVIAGSKLEHNDYTGVDYQPQARLVWTPAASHAFWAAISRALRVPSRGDANLALHAVYPGVGPNDEAVVLDLDGNPDSKSEILKAYEAGYRFERRSFSLDLAAYYNQYDSLLQTVVSVTQLPSVVLMSYNHVNDGRAQTHGIELGMRWRPQRRWTLAGGITETRGSVDALQATPKHLLNLQSHVNVTRRLDFHTALYHYGGVPLGSVVNFAAIPPLAVPEFDRVDVGGSWHLLPEWTLGVWGQNLQSPRHVETRDTLFGNEAGEVPRSVAFKLMWQSRPESSGSK